MDDKLNYFGKILISDVRDRTIHGFDMRITGMMKDEDSQKLYEEIKKMDNKQIELIKKIIPQIVDLSLHNMLCMIEENTKIKVQIENECIDKISDGLAGELYSEDGWIQRFSKERCEEI